MNFLERFGEKIECGPYMDSCWNWTSADNGTGYGQISINDKTFLAHRISYQLFRGKIPEDLHIDHLCRNRGCVNPDHLEAVTHKENMIRGRSNNRLKTHCPQGHEYTEDNTYVSGNKRTCKTCRRIKDKERREVFKNSKL